MASPLIAQDKKPAAPGPAASPSPVPSASPSPSPTTALFRDYSSSLVVIEGDTSTGSGFIGQVNGAPVVLTNTHVLSGNSRIRVGTLNGRDVKLVSMSIAESYDVSAIRQEGLTSAIPISSAIDSEVNIGDPVIVLGNSLGSGVVTELPGKVTGIGPELIEVDAPFVPGNSGSPVIHVPSKKVIGIATFSILRKFESFGKDSKFNNVERRFAYRLDNVPMWKAVNWTQFSADSKKVYAMTQHTDDLWDLARDISLHGSITYGDHVSPDNSLSKIILDFQSKMAKTGVAPAYFLDEKKRLLWRLHSELDRDTRGVDFRSFTTYHQKKVEEQMQYRDALRKFFDSLDAQLTADPYFKAR